VTWLADTRRSYDTVASAYADFVRAPLAAYMQAALSVFASKVTGAVGVDLSPGMISVARKAYPGLPFAPATGVVHRGFPQAPSCPQIRPTPVSPAQTQ
jgi:argininosuccinate synthase